MEKTNKSKYADLELLKQGQTQYAADPSKARLEMFSNSHKKRNYTIQFICPEFTTRCPVTNQPDFGEITIEYIPADLCIESKSLKIYLGSFREFETFHEEAVNRILDDIVEACQPRQAKVKGEFRPRGGISIVVNCEYISE